MSYDQELTIFEKTSIIAKRLVNQVKTILPYSILKKLQISEIFFQFTSCKVSLPQHNVSTLQMMRL